jgi:hypothetical protein
MLHRNGGYTLERYATFKAQRPGRFNLSLTSNPTTVKPDKGGYPIIVVDRETPITGIVWKDNHEGFSRRPNGEEYSSSWGGGTSYLTNVLVIQTGDQFTFKFASVVRSARSEWKEREDKKFEDEEAVAPVVHKLAFTFDQTWGYNEWIKDSLP